MSTLSKYLSLVKFAHTIFAMPFALAAYFYAMNFCGGWTGWKDLLLMLLCMVAARNAAMGFNRWADRDIDALNPRTAGREIPAGKISPGAALAFVIANCIIFIVSAGFLNRLALMLSPVALIVLLGYSYTKRFTWMAHFVLGLALSIAPAGASIAVAGTILPAAMWLSALVLTWVGGFDILYSLQDSSFDREKGLHSVPSKFSVGQSISISIGVHIISMVIVLIIGFNFFAGNIIYWVGASLFSLILVVQHIIATPKHLGRIGATFTLINGLSSIVYAGFFIAAVLIS